MLDADEPERSREEMILESQARQALLAALRQLPSRMRQATLHWAMGVHGTVIAQDMGIAAATVRVHLHQARLRLAADPVLAGAYRTERNGGS